MDNTYPTDKVIGILVIVFSVCAAIGGLLIVLGGGILGAAGVGSRNRWRRRRCRCRRNARRDWIANGTDKRSSDLWRR